MSDRGKINTISYPFIAGMSDDKLCLKLSEKSILIFLSLIEYAEWKTRWHKPDGLPLTQSEIDDIKKWAGEAAYDLMSTYGCEEDDGDCVGWGNVSRVVEYFPNHPNDQTTPSGYLFPPWYIAPDFNLIGAPTGAVVTDITRFPYDPFQPAETLPRFRVSFTGKGTVELHLVTIYNGGNALIQVDGDLGQIEILDLNQDLIAVPPETENIVIIERTFEAEGDHFIDVTMVPVLQNEIPPVLFGGGIMKIVFCGQVEPDGEDLEFVGGCDDMAQYVLCWKNTEDGWKLVYTLNGGCTYSDVKECGTDNLVYFPQPNPVVPLPPEDEEGGYPVPEIDPENRALQKCRVLDGAFKWLLLTRAEAFITDVLNGTVAAAGSNIVVWLDTLTEEDPNYTQYYPRWKSFYEKHYPYVANLNAIWESAIWADFLECIVSNCLPENLDVTRDVMNCISDTVEASDAYGSGDDAVALRAFLVDYINSIPLSAIRNRVFRQAQSTDTPTCADCGEDPAPVGCGVYTPFKWAGVPLTDGLGWVAEIEASPAAWAIDDASFTGVTGGVLMSRYSAGWSYTQTPSASKAGSIAYEFEEPFDFCELYARVTTSTGKGNTRYAVAWAQAEGGLWVPLVGKRLNIYQSGEVSLQYTAPSPISIIRLKLVGLVGGGDFRFNDIIVNGNMAP